MSRGAFIILLVVLAAGITSTAAACPSCYGQAEGPVIDGMNNAITAMIGITGFVLSGFIFMFIAIGRRSRLMREADATTDTTINEQGAIQWKNS